MKKQLIVLILKLLETCSDETHPLTQVQIAKMIDEKYACDRKTVGRNIKALQKLGYPIEKTLKGFYMKNQLFSRREVSFLLDLVQNSNPTDIDKDDLCRRLQSSLSRYYKR